MKKKEINGIIIIVISIIIIIVLNIRENEINKIKIAIEDRDEYQEYVDATCKKLGLDETMMKSIESLDDNSFVVLDCNGDKYLFLKYEEENYGCFIKKVYDVSSEYEDIYDDNILRINFNASYKTGTKGCFPDYSRKTFVIKLNQDIDTVYAVNDTMEKETQILKYEHSKQITNDERNDL